MIIFHEGLPRSGKSYEAITKQVLMYLAKGRQCFCFVDGLNFEMFSEILDISVETLKGETILTPIADIEKSKHLYTRQVGNQLYSIEYKGLLFQIEENQVLEVYNYVANDSFVILDELQDYFPVSTKPLEEGIRKFVTQHGHRGIDILVMGQAHEDCHNLWKRRIDQLIIFEKRDAIGQPNNYTWRSHKQQKKGNRFIFIPIRSGKGTYDKKYFGLYKSHTSNVDNTDNHTDDRANIFKSSMFTIYLPIFLVILFFSVTYLIKFFSVKDDENEPVSLQKSYISSAQAATKPIVQNKASSKEIDALLNEKRELEKQLAEHKTKDFSEENYLKTISKRYRARVSGFIEDDKKIRANIQFLDSSFHVHEELSLKQIKSLGWDYKRMPYGIKLIHGETTLVVTSWPLDSVGKVSNYTSSQLN